MPLVLNLGSLGVTKEAFVNAILNELGISREEAVKRIAAELGVELPKPIDESIARAITLNEMNTLREATAITERLYNTLGSALNQSFN